MAYTEDRATWFEGQGHWQHIPASDWQDWTWQLKNRITTLDQLERRYILHVLEQEDGNQSKAAERLGIDRRTLYRKLKEYRALQQRSA